MKLYYIANARMPSEKAHGIQIAKMCEAFIEEGVDVRLVVPSRRTSPESVQEYYRLRVPVPTTRLLVPDLYLYGTVGYRISSALFMLEHVAYLWWKRLTGERFVAYTVDLDNFSSSALPLAGAPLFTEMHGGKPVTLAQRILFRAARGVIAINPIIVEELKGKFASSKARYLVEPNGVDAADFAPMEKSEARKALGLPQDTPIILYAGRFFDWKGLEILPKAAALMPESLWCLVGGDERHFKEFVHEAIPGNLRFMGSRPHAQMRAWLAAADALIVLGTKRDTQSYYYTSPMKLFEYLLSGRPIVASRTPAVQHVVSDAEALFYEPDRAEDLAERLKDALRNDGTIRSRVDAAQRKGAAHSWKARAQRIRHFMAN